VRSPGADHSLLAESEVEVNTDAGLMHPGHPADDERLAGKPTRRILAVHPLLHVVRQRDRFAPGHRGSSLCAECAEHAPGAQSAKTLLRTAKMF
jgi:hypothetical protein